MKNFKFILATLFLSTLAQASIIKITRERFPKNSHHHQIILYTLKSQKNKVSCKVDKSPAHAVGLRQTLKMEAPQAFSKSVASNCEDIVHWGKKSYCYKKYEVSQLDDIFRQCANF